MPFDVFFCAKCLAGLVPGSGEFFEVRIQAVVDPYPPAIDLHDQSTGEKLSETLAKSSLLSEAELHEQGMLARTIHLCVGCFPAWIESSTGQS